MSDDSWFWIYRCDYVRCTDGDTADVWVDLGFRHKCQMRIRLLGINAPEMTGKTSVAGRAAKAHLETLLKPPGLILQSHKDKADKFGGRFLGVFFRGETNLNEQMILDGHAVRYEP